MSCDFDVVIVGGGPAGTATALHLVRQDRIAASRILVLEKARHPRVKPCAGAVSAWGVEALGAIGVDVTVPHVVLRGLRVLAGRHTGEQASALGVVVRRCEFDAHLWDEVRAAGVVAFDGEPVTGVEAIPGGWRVLTVRRSVTAGLLAACDGAGSAVRKMLGIREVARKGHLYVAETPAGPLDEGPAAALCDFDLRVADEGVEGYYWDFPVTVDGRPGVSRGIYHANFTPRPGLKRVLARALERRELDVTRLDLRPFSTRPFVRGAPLAGNRLALVGEAAGIDATTGEGIAQAILMAAIASRHLARALRVGDGRLDGYARDVLGSRMGRHLLQSSWLARRVYGPRRGARWRSFLAREDLAREAGARWYEGRSLGWTMKARLAGKLALALTA